MLVSEGQHALPAAVRRQQRVGAVAAGRLDGLDLLLPALLTRRQTHGLLPHGGRKGATSELQLSIVWATVKAPFSNTDGQVYIDRYFVILANIRTKGHFLLNYYERGRRPSQFIVN